MENINGLEYHEDLLKHISTIGVDVAEAGREFAAYIYNMELSEIAVIIDSSKDSLETKKVHKALSDWNIAIHEFEVCLGGIPIEFSEHVFETLIKTIKIQERPETFDVIVKECSSLPENQRWDSKKWYDKNK